jgi:hypothetical protein
MNPYRHLRLLVFSTALFVSVFLLARILLSL